MSLTRPVSSTCRFCGDRVLWAQLENGTRVPLDRSRIGPVRLLRGAGLLVAVFLSYEELAAAMGQQREAIARGEQPEQLYALHPAVCRQAAKARPRARRRPRRRKAR